VVTTSEFNDVKARLVSMHSHRKLDDKDANRPRLRRANGTGTVDDTTGVSDSTTTKTDSDDRPTLKRRENP
jgi:hypothetical protein